jgi:HK97 family phage prohead protease
MTLHHKDFGLEIKGIDETGYIEGLAAGYGNVDHGGDRILPGAFTKSLQGRSGVPMLLYHDMKRPIGKWSEFRETEQGLLTKGKIAIKTRDGGEAHELASNGALSGLSIGYEPLVKRMAGKVRELVELALHEVSLVSIGMNPLATVTNVKTILEDGELPSLPQFEEFLREAGFSKTQATAIAGKGLAPLLRGEPGNTQAADFLSALKAEFSA